MLTDRERVLVAMPCYGGALHVEAALALRQISARA